MMADSQGIGEVPSKIPLYKPLNSKIPVLSKTYICQLKHIKDNKEDIERRRAEIQVLKTDLAATIMIRSNDFINDTDKVSCEKQHVEEEPRKGLEIEQQPTVSPYFKSEIRTTIVTPKGTKRKG
jgi:hypothetical protein